MTRYVGLDVHKRVVEACIIDEEGAVLQRLGFALTRESLVAFAKKTLKKSDRVVVRHKLARDLDNRPGGPIEEVIDYLPGRIADIRTRSGRQEFKVDLERSHPTGQEWFWLGVVYPEGFQP